MASHDFARWRAPGGAAVAVALFATLIVGVCAVNAVGRIGQPFAGFFYWENLFVPAVGAPSWTGVRSGLRYQSWILEVDGRAVADAGDVDALLSGREPGDTVTYHLEVDGERYTAPIEMMELSPRVWASVLGIYVIDALILLAAGLVLLYMKPADTAARALFYFAADLAIYIATSADLFGPYLFRVAYFVSLNLIPVLVFRLLSHFPVGRVRARAETWGLAVFAVVGVMLGTASNFSFFQDREFLLAIDGVTHSLLAVSGLAGIVFFCWHFVRARSPLARARTQVVLLGTVGAFLPPVIALSLVFLLGIPVALNLVTLTFVLFPLSIAYAIARHNLFDVDRIIRRTIVYVVLSALVFGSYSLGIGVVDYFFENLTQVGSRIAEGILILSLILVTSPSRDRIQDVVDRLYDRHRYNYRDVVRSTSKAFTTILDVEELVSLALTLVDETLQPLFAAVYTVDTDGRAEVRGRLRHAPGEDRVLELEPRDARPVDLSAYRAVLGSLAVLDADAVGAGKSEGEVAEVLAVLAAPVAVPMTLEGRLVGVLTVGGKRSGGIHTRDDFDLMRTMCDQLAVALDNARAYQTIDLLNVDLEAKNIELSAANAELREAQAEVVRTERLAAVGELAGAVAHAIRNPLAGIKAAAQLAALDLEGHEAQESLRDVISEADRLNDRIGALLQYTRPFEPELRSVAPRDVIDHAVRDTAARAAARAIVVRTTCSPELPSLLGDPVLLEQAVLELISNAVDATPDGGAIDVSVSAEGNAGTGRVVIAVVDGGPGIHAQAAERIFDLFYTTKARGTGFGLATVKKIVERHGGTVRAENRAGRGAAFTISLPLAADQRRPNFSSR